MTLIWPFKVTKGQTDYAILFATFEFLSVFHNKYSAISLGNPVFPQIALIWPLEVTKGQIGYAFRSATYNFLSTFNSDYSAISLRLRDSRCQTSEDLAGNSIFVLLKIIDLNWFLVSFDHLLALFNALHPWAVYCEGPLSLIWRGEEGEGQKKVRNTFIPVYIHIHIRT